MRKVLTIVLVLLLTFSMTACGNSNSNRNADTDLSDSEQGTSIPSGKGEVPENNEGSPLTIETESQLEVFSVGETITTDMVEFTLDEVRFADKVGLDSDTWLRPIVTGGGMVPSEGKVFVWFQMTVKNISTADISGYDVCNAVVTYGNYGNEYRFENGVYTTDGWYRWSTESSISSNVGLTTMTPLDTQTYIGYIQCAEDVRSNREGDLFVEVTLPSGTGSVSYRYVYNAPEGTDISGDAAAVSTALRGILEEFDFIATYGQNLDAGGGSYQGMSDDLMNRAEEALNSIDETFVNDNLPETAAIIPVIRENISTIRNYDDQMTASGRATYVEEVVSLANTTVSLINQVLDTELSAFN